MFETDNIDKLIKTNLDKIILKNNVLKKKSNIKTK